MPPGVDLSGLDATDIVTHDRFPNMDPSLVMPPRDEMIPSVPIGEHDDVEVASFGVGCVVAPSSPRHISFWSGEVRYFLSNLDPLSY